MSGDHRLTLKQACDILGKKERTVRRYVQTGLLSKIYVDGDNGWELRLSESEVRALADGVSVTPRGAEAESDGAETPEAPIPTSRAPYAMGQGIEIPPTIVPSVEERRLEPWPTGRRREDPGDLRLAEAFARYFELVQREHESGRDAYLLGLDESLRQARRGSPGAAGKGVWVLHMLRHELGDPVFWPALERFAQQYGFETGTPDLLLDVLGQTAAKEGPAPSGAAARRETARDRLARFTPWFQHPSLPQVTVSWRWDPGGPGIRLALAQIADPEEEAPPFYLLPMSIQCIGPQGSRTFSITMSRREEEFCFQLPLRPRMVLLDPEHELALILHASKRTEEWLEQLRHGPDALHRVRAIDGLRGAWGAPEVEAALRQVVYEDPSGGVRAAAARALAPVSNAALVRSRSASWVSGPVTVTEEAVAAVGAPVAVAAPPQPAIGEESLSVPAFPDLDPVAQSAIRNSQSAIPEVPVATEVEQLKRELRRLRAEQAQIERRLLLLELRTRPRVNEEPASALPEEGE